MVADLMRLQCCCRTTTRCRKSTRSRLRVAGLPRSSLPLSPPGSPLQCVTGVCEVGYGSGWNVLWDCGARFSHCQSAFHTHSAPQPQTPSSRFRFGDAALSQRPAERFQDGPAPGHYLQLRRNPLSRCERAVADTMQVAGRGRYARSLPHRSGNETATSGTGPASGA